MALGRPGTHAMFIEMLEAGLSKVKVIEQPAKIVAPRLFHLPEHQFWHGMAGVGHRAVIAFFYERTGQGLAGLMKDLFCQEVLLLRMSMFEVSGPAVISPTRGSA